MASPSSLPLSRSEWNVMSQTGLPCPLTFTLAKRVRYFPKGHLEHSVFEDEQFSAEAFLKEKYQVSFLCEILNIQFRVDSLFDECFCLLYVTRGLSFPACLAYALPLTPEGPFQPSCYWKTLTPADHSSKLYLNDDSRNVFTDPPVHSNDIVVTDSKGNEWNFVHARARGNRFVLRAGWPKFRKEKNLETGDKLVFMKDSFGIYRVGIHRFFNHAATQGQNRLAIHGNRGVQESLAALREGRDFVSIFHPRRCHYIVDAELIETAERIGFVEGMKVIFNNQSATVTHVHRSPDEIERHGPNVVTWKLLEIAIDGAAPETPTIRVNAWEVRVPDIH